MVAGRETVIKLRVRVDEKIEVKARAANQNLSLSDYMREQVGLQVNRKPPGRPRAFLRHFEREQARLETEPGVAALESLRRKLNR